MLTEYTCSKPSNCSGQSGGRPFVESPGDQFPAFIRIELTGFSQSTVRRFGNFSSILTVDLLQLEEQNVTNIT